MCSQTCMISFMSCSMMRMPSPSWSRNQRIRSMSSTFSNGFIPAAGQTDVAAIRPVHAGNQIEHGGFAGAVGSNEAEQLARIEGEVEGIDGLQAAEAQRAVLSFQKRHSVISRMPIRPPGRVSIM